MMTKEEEERMMAEILKNNTGVNYYTANAGEDAYGNVVGPDAEIYIQQRDNPELRPNMFDQATTMLSGEYLMKQPTMDSAAPIMTPQEQISPMERPMTPEQIDEEINRLKILKNNMLLDQLKDMGYGRN